MLKRYRLYFERSGGFSGLTINVEIKSDELKPDEKLKLDSLTPIIHLVMLGLKFSD